MKIIKLMGGLGNQLFQYAFGIALADKSGDSVLFDDAVLRRAEICSRNDTVRQYALDAYKVSVNFATREQLHRCLTEGAGPYQRLYNRWRQFLGKKNKKSPNIVREKLNCGYEPELLTLRGNRYYECYAQTERYFAEYRTRILQDLTLREPLDEANDAILQRIKNCEAVSLHIRRGDYLKHPDLYALCEPEYYHASARRIAEHCSHPVFFVFSEDLSWARGSLSLPFDCVYVDVNSSATAYADLELMRHCRHHIIANSSFSWWGAWLNPHPDKIVIAPRQWLVGEKNAETVDITPKEWIKM